MIHEVTHLLGDVVKSTLTVTCLVMVMLLLIEYINIRSAGKLTERLQHKPFLQIVFASLLGLIPGCIGGFAIVSLFTHRMLSFGAMTAGMISTFGDEAFILFSYSPRWTFILSGCLFLIAVMTGCITQLFVRKKKFRLEEHPFEIHDEHVHNADSIEAGLSFKNLKNISFPRALLLFGISIYILAILTGTFSHQHGGMPDFEHNHTEMVHDHAACSPSSPEQFSAEKTAHTSLGWENILFLILACIVFFIVALSPEHFLQSHLWEHVIKQHFLSILLWTFGVLLLLQILYYFIDVNNLIETHQWALYILLLLAVVIGLIPESGPHLVFVIMFFSGAIPFSILLASSIVQDGHGALPLLAQSRKNFFLMKAINLFTGLFFGSILLFLGY